MSDEDLPSPPPLESTYTVAFCSACARDTICARFQTSRATFYRCVACDRVWSEPHRDPPADPSA